MGVALFLMFLQINALFYVLLNLTLLYYGWFGIVFDVYFANFLFDFLCISFVVMVIGTVTYKAVGGNYELGLKVPFTERVIL